MDILYRPPRTVGLYREETDAVTWTPVSRDGSASITAVSSYMSQISAAMVCLSTEGVSYSQGPCHCSVCVTTEPRYEAANGVITWAVFGLVPSRNRLFLCVLMDNKAYRGVGGAGAVCLPV